MKKILSLVCAALLCLTVTAATYCPAESIPYVQSFTGHATTSEYSYAAPECWVISSATPNVWVYIEKNDDGVIRGSEYLYIGGGSSTTVQVFAMPAFQAALNTLEVAFDYKNAYTTAAYGALEIGYMTDPEDASTFVSLTTLTKVSTMTHVVYSLANVPSTATRVAFRLAGGTSSFGSARMDNFVVAPIGQSSTIDPTQDQPDPQAQAYLISQSYCEAQFAWYAYMVEAFKIDIYTAEGQLVNAVPVTTGECDRFAQEDQANGIFKGFSQQDDYENMYYCSTKWLLNADESSMLRGDAWASSVKNIGTAISPILGLNPGSYEIRISKLNATTFEIGEVIGTIPFTLESKQVTNLTAAVADNRQTATLTWTTPELATGERLYVSVRSGESVAYDNYDTMEEVTSPLTVNVEEGKSYTATVLVVDRNMNPMGDEVAYDFTVGTNPYEPINPQAEVFGGDNVTFTWHADSIADFYDIVLYWNGAYYTTLSVRDTIKTTTMPQDGTWTWTVQPFTQGSNGKYFPASNAIEGNSFVSKAADIPDDAIVLDVWTIEAAYMDAASGYDAGGRYAWFISLATGEEGSNGLPSPLFMIYTNQQYAISGVYNSARGNIDLSNCGMDMTGAQTDAIDAVEAELRLQFDGYDDDKAAQGGYRYGYYTGQFRIVGTDGKTYVGKFMEQFCNSFNFSSYGAAYRDHVGMWDEDPDYVVPQDIELVQPSDTGVQKVLIDGTIYILRDNAIYTIQGTRVK